tara:strand:- start:632 stop:1078 length:447 start_codon:yes stop_codon:yes gene_type:complete
MENYELTFIISANIPETEHQEIQKKVSDYIKDIKGQISKQSYSLGRKKFAYPIKNQKNGFYISLEFKLEDKDDLKELDTKLKYNDNILRYLVVKKPFFILEEKKEKKKEEKKEKKKEEKKEEKKEKKKEEVIKINLDNIDESLDDLLD